jgi:hypothetical protein
MATALGPGGCADASGEDSQLASCLQVRRLIYACFTALYTYGDNVTIYLRANNLHAYLSSKEGMSRSTPEVRDCRDAWLQSQADSHACA